MSYNGITSAHGGQAWGNIFTVNTPDIDQLGQQLYANEQNRQLRQQNESNLLDQQFQKNIGKIRDEDTDEYTDKYNTFKQSKLALMKMNPHNQKAYIQANMDSNRKLADMSQFANTSISNKAGLQQILSKYDADKTGEFTEDTYPNVMKAMQTPSSQWGSLTKKDENGNDAPFNPLDIDQYKYQGNTVKWQPILTKSEGDKREATTPIVNLPNNSGTQTTTITAKNSPLDYYNNLAGSLVGSRAAGSLNATYKYSDDDAQNIVQQYNDKILNNPNAKLIWGEQGVKLPTNALLTPATRTAALKSMEYALSNPPQESAPKVEPNWTGRNAIEFQQKKDLQKSNDALISTREQNMNNASMDVATPLLKTVQDRFQNKDTYPKIRTGDGKTDLMGAVPLSGLPSEQAAAVINVADQLKPKKGGHSVNDLLVRLDNTGGVGIVNKYDGTLIGSASANSLNLSANQKLGQKAKQSQIKGADITNTPSTNTYSHTREEFKAAGWTEGQINSAQKAGRITVK